METIKISLRLGDAEFSAEGPAEMVQAQFDAFLAVVKATPPPASGNQPPNASPGNGVDTTPAVDTTKPVPIDSTIMQRVFSNEKSYVALRALPKSGAADALLLILYGFSKLRNEDSVTGSALMAAATKSGLQVGRIDRTMDGQTQYVTSAGARRAKRYGLNIPGLAQAEKILGEILK